MTITKLRDLLAAEGITARLEYGAISDVLYVPAGDLTLAASDVEGERVIALYSGTDGDYDHAGRTGAVYLDRDDVERAADVVWSVRNAEDAARVTTFEAVPEWR